RPGYGDVVERGDIITERDTAARVGDDHAAAAGGDRQRAPDDRVGIRGEDDRTGGDLSHGIEGDQVGPGQLRVDPDAAREIVRSDERDRRVDAVEPLTCRCRSWKAD